LQYYDSKNQVHKCLLKNQFNIFWAHAPRRPPRAGGAPRFTLQSFWARDPTHDQKGFPLQSLVLGGILGFFGAPKDFTLVQVYGERFMKVYGARFMKVYEGLEEV